MEPGDNGTVFYYTPPHFTTECFDKVFPSMKKNTNSSRHFNASSFNHLRFVFNKEIDKVVLL